MGVEGAEVEEEGKKGRGVEGALVTWGWKPLVTSLYQVIVPLSLSSVSTAWSKRREWNGGSSGGRRRKKKRRKKRKRER